MPETIGSSIVTTLPADASHVDMYSDDEGIKITCRDEQYVQKDQSDEDNQKTSIKDAEILNNERNINDGDQSLEPAYIIPELAYITNPINIWLNYQQQQNQPEKIGVHQLGQQSPRKENVIDKSESANVKPPMIQCSSDKMSDDLLQEQSSVYQPEIVDENDNTACKGNNRDIEQAPTASPEKSEQETKSQDRLTNLEKLVSTLQIKIELLEQKLTLLEPESNPRLENPGQQTLCVKGDYGHSTVETSSRYICNKCIDRSRRSSNA